MFLVWRICLKWLILFRHRWSTPTAAFESRTAKEIFNSKLKLDFESFMCEMEKMADNSSDIPSSLSCTDNQKKPLGLRLSSQTFLPDLNQQKWKCDAKSE